MIAVLLLVVGLPREAEFQASRLAPPRAWPRPSACVELRAALWWVERGDRPWSGRSPLSGPDRRQPAFGEPGPVEEPPADAPPG